MSKKVIALVGGGISLAALAWLATATPGCGGSSSGSNANDVALCEQLLTKLYGCVADSGIPGVTVPTSAQIMQMCTSPDAGASSMNPNQCTNASAVRDNINKCVAMNDCAAFQSCLLAVPCQMGSTGAAGSTGSGAGGSTGSAGRGGSTGAAGTTGAGGSTTGTGGAGGSGTTASCDACTKADACFTAISPGTSGGFASACDAATDDVTRQSRVAACQQFTQSAVTMIPNAPAACQ
jgi:hypothetical protein